MAYYGPVERKPMTAKSRQVTTIEVSKSLHQRLKQLKPYDSVTFNDLISEMADNWEETEG